MNVHMAFRGAGALGEQFHTERGPNSDPTGMRRGRDQDERPDGPFGQRGGDERAHRRAEGQADQRHRRHAERPQRTEHQRDLTEHGGQISCHPEMHCGWNTLLYTGQSGTPNFVPPNL